MKKPYLLAYNGLCAAAWAFCWRMTAEAWLGGLTPAEAYESMGMVLVGVQTAMLLEILHAAIGLVPSPVIMVAIQVSSRIFIVWGHTYWVPACQAHWSIFMMVTAWSITEVIRYAFYFCALLGDVPYSLFWLRYSLFMVMYPVGISGEVLQTLVGMGAHWKLANPFWYRFCVLTLMAYVPLSPVMILNMWGNRKRSFKKRDSSAEEPSGVVWPKTKKGDRSSTGTNRAVLAASAKAGPNGEVAEAKVLKEKNWRFGYIKHLRDHVAQSLESEEGCLSMARAGLDSAQSMFMFRRDGQEEMPMKEAMEKLASDLFETAELKGEEPMPSKRELFLNYGGGLGKPYYHYKKFRNNKITGMELRKQLEEWVEYGTMEADVADALKELQLNQDKWLDLSDMYFVLLGAASAMGPLLFLLSLGANVVAVARPKALKGVIAKAKNSPGKLLFPVKKGSDWKGLLENNDMDGLAEVAGCDLMTQTPEIAAWLSGVAPGKALTIGNYTYLDGALHVQIAVACDCIMDKVCKARKSTSLAFLGTPTDAHVVTDSAVEATKAAYAGAASWMKMWEAIGVLKPNKAIEVSGISYMDAIVSDQGPNYILAKRMQHWRAMVARADGHIASSNVSPSTATSSVMKNASFAAAYGGMHIFKPMEVIFQELSLSLMGALLIHDLRNEKSVARPSTKIKHPLCLFQATSFHGGVWRCPYTISTIGIPSAITYYLSVFRLQIGLGVVGFGTTLQYLFLGSSRLTSLVPAAALQLPLDLVAPLATAASVPL